MFPSQKPWDRRTLGWGQLLLPASWGGRELTPREMNGGQLPIRNVSPCWGLAWMKSEPGPEGKQFYFPDSGGAVAKMQGTRWRSRELVLSSSQGSRGTLTPFPGRQLCRVLGREGTFSRRGAASGPLCSGRDTLLLCPGSSCRPPAHQGWVKSSFEQKRSRLASRIKGAFSAACPGH